MDIYRQCPEYETADFLLRQVRMEDAEALLDCYSDRAAVSKANTDGCTSDFYYTQKEEMEDCIRFWLEEYQKGYYVRFAIVPKEGKDKNRAVGTMEIFGGDSGVWRLDIASRYEKEENIEQLLRLTVFQLIGDFGIGSLKVKAGNIPERVPLLEKYGFVPTETFRPGLGYFERSKANFFDPAKGLAYCGLACCVCSENGQCAGCRNDGCKGKEWCKGHTCCTGSEKSGCWDCEKYPCGFPMLEKPRVRAFTEYIKTFGEDDLITALGRNEANGILYHYPGKLIGDYDQMDIQEIIRQGGFHPKA